MQRILSSLSWNYILLAHLKLLSSSSFTNLTDLSAVDDTERGSFRVVYMVQSIDLASALVLDLSANASDTQALSCVTCYGGLAWPEREVWDMFGIFFWGNTDLRRILSSYGFVGHPLRKDFPLSGFKEMWYDDTVRAVISVNAEFSQELRLNNY